MTRHCAALGCSTDTRYPPKHGPPPRFAKFPGKVRKLQLRFQWLKNLNRMNQDGTPWEPKAGACVCHKHFVTGAPTPKHPVPQIDMGHPFVTEVTCRVTLQPRELPKKPSKSIRVCGRRTRNKQNMPGKMSAFPKIPIELSQDGHQQSSEQDSAGTEIGHTQPYLEVEDYICTDGPYQQKVVQDFHNYAKPPIQDPRVQQLENELLNTIAKLQSANNELKIREKPCSYKIIEADDEKTRQFTGFPSYECFKVVFDKLIQPKAKRLATNHVRGARNWYKGRCKSKPGPSRKIELIDEFFLVMMRLRMGLMYYDLAVRFRVSRVRVSVMMSRWLPFLAHCLRKLVQPPSKEQIQKHMPPSFKKKHPKTRVIIDCTEIFMERPSNLLARQQTWSTYKSHNTAKILIGCTPEGGISHVSKAWGGRTSDKHITLHSGFMDTLEPYDEVMAVRGFTISGDLAEISCTLNLPPFTHGKSQLSQGEVQKHRTVSSLRIHVERVIERLKNFVVLQGIYRVSQYRLLNDTLTVCAAVVNLWEPIVKK